MRRACSSPVGGGHVMPGREGLSGWGAGVRGALAVTPRAVCLRLFGCPRPRLACQSTDALGRAGICRDAGMCRDVQGGGPRDWPSCAATCCGEAWLDWPVGPARWPSTQWHLKATRSPKQERPLGMAKTGVLICFAGPDLNQRPLGYEPNELPDCSTPRQSDGVPV